MLNKLLTGVIKSNTKPIIFSVPEGSFFFSFMTESMHSFPKRAEVIKVQTEDGFIYGNTHGNYDIAIYFGKQNFEVRGSSGLNTSAYVKSCANAIEQNIREFETISFKGGTLNSAFDINAMDFEYQDNTFLIKAKDDSIKYSFYMGEEKVNVYIRSEIQENFGVQGSSITNKDAILTLEFEKKQPLIKIFECYNGIKNLLSFLAFRHNVGFDEIYISNTEPRTNQKIKAANVYIKNEYELTTKDFFNNIRFNEIKDVLPNLTKIFFRTSDEEPINLGFIPDNDIDRDIMSDVKIREICSALEHELNFVSDIKVEENVILNKLIETAKETIKNFRKENEGLSNDTYSMISSSIGHWSFPLTEKLCALCRKYEEELLALNTTNIVINDDLIKAFVKYRNAITHGRHRTPDMETAIAAFYMCGIIYCCILERVGVSREVIMQFCKNKLLK